MKHIKLKPSNLLQDLINSKGPDTGIRLGLENIKTLLTALGNPQDTIPYVIHIAGTNGKGSTLAFLESLLKNSSFKVGKYTSPHLISVTERFVIDGEPISEAKLEEIVCLLNSSSEIFKELTFFEKLTAAAFYYFAQEQVDILLLETGLGGRLDASNVVAKPALTLITNIGFDHQEFLGESLSEIAVEKAGILKKNIPFCTTADEPALSVIREQAKKISAIELNLQNFSIPEQQLHLKGKHQKQNALLALNAYLYLINQVLPGQSNLEPQEIKYSAVYNAHWPGRFQEINYENCKIILDGAHNQAGAQSLKLTLKEFFPSKKKVWLLGFLKNKDFESMLNELIDPNDCVILTLPTNDSKSASLEILEACASKLKRASKVLSIENPKDALQVFCEKLKENPSEQIGIVSGSLYLVGEILQISESF
jgi:dihydrofolate synthase/folylpolyglutamate synthase